MTHDKCIDMTVGADIMVLIVGDVP